MTARIIYEVRGHRTPVDELLTRTPLQRFIDLEEATREQLGGHGLQFSDVRAYLERALMSENPFDLVENARDILLYRAICWLVILPGAPEASYAETAGLAVGDIATSVLGELDEGGGDAPKDQAAAPAPTT